MFEKYIKEKESEMIDSLCKAIKFPSISEFSGDPAMPFGKACKDVLEYCLSLGDSLGFRTKNIDGYCGYIEFGEGTELIGIIGHLDVVPADDTWTYSPFSPTVEDGKIYGRGAIDDKGPVISSLYAMKAVMDSMQIQKRVRLILGLNEEKDWKCIQHYLETEEVPSVSFSPDADFPCIYAEKGILSLALQEDYHYKKIEILEVDCQDNAINVVPKYCHVVLGIGDNIDSVSFKNVLKEVIAKTKFEIDVYQLNNSTFKITSHGTSAHAAHPDLGINAIARLLVILQMIYSTFGETCELFEFFSKYIHTEFNGNKLRMDYQDESGALTLNVGKFSLENNQLKICFNLRVPIHTNLQTVEEEFANVLKKYSNISSSIIGKKDLLFMDKNGPYITLLCDIFNQVTGQNQKPIAIGGATYARAFPNCVSFGANMPGHADMCHQANEYISVDNLITSSIIYATALYELCK